ncbi:nuclear transport factor 2 family protein [Gordonia terrae]
MTYSQSTPVGQIDERALSALLACQQVIVDSYARADADQRGSVADLFVEDGWQRLGPEEMNGREMIREVMGSRDGTGRRTLHTVSDVRVTGTPSNDELHLAYNLTLYLLSGETPCIPNALASVADVLVERNGQWLLKNRTLSVLAPSH